MGATDNLKSKDGTNERLAEISKSISNLIARLNPKGIDLIESCSVFIDNSPIVST